MTSARTTDQLIQAAAMPVLEGELVRIEYDPLPISPSRRIPRHEESGLEPGLISSRWTFDDYLAVGMRTVMVVVGLAVAIGACWVVYSIVMAIGMAIAMVGHWVSQYGALAVFVILALMLCGGGAAAKCAGLHCGGCKG